PRERRAHALPVPDRRRERREELQRSPRPRVGGVRALAGGRDALMSSIVFIGAGAIGRGYLPWVFPPGRYEYAFVDQNAAIVDKMAAGGRYKTGMVKGAALEPREVKVAHASRPDAVRPAAIGEVAAVFLSVGPRNVPQAAKIAGALG